MACPRWLLVPVTPIKQDLKDFARTAGNVHYSEVSRSDPSEGWVILSANRLDSANMFGFL